jgi:hypothetical protein
MAKKVPQRRNKNAGKISGSTKRMSKKARDNKKKYDTAYHATPERKKYRAKLNKANNESPNKKSQDKSHTKSGKIVNEKRSSNRRRNGKKGSSKK